MPPSVSPDSTRWNFTAARLTPTFAGARGAGFSSGRLGVVERTTDDQRTDGHEEQKQHRYGVAPGLCTPIDAAHQPPATDLALQPRCLGGRGGRQSVSAADRRGVDDRARSRDERAGRAAREGACDVSRGSALGADARGAGSTAARGGVPRRRRGCVAPTTAPTLKAPLADQVLPHSATSFATAAKGQAVGELQILDLAAFVGRLDEAEDACPVAAGAPNSGSRESRPRYGLTVSASARGASLEVGGRIRAGRGADVAALAVGDDEQAACRA